MPANQRFLKREHLRLRQDFARVLGGKCKVADSVLVVYAAKNELPFSRIGISVSKRIGNAVRRHYVKRRIREVFRRSKSDLPGGLDFVCIARPPATEATVDVAASLRKLVLKAAEQCRISDPDRPGQLGTDSTPAL